jgi:16S rRNA processing protein RimM
MSDNFLLVGYIVGSFGVRGQVKLKIISDNPEHIAQNVKTIYLQQAGRRNAQEAYTPHHIQSVIQHKPGILVVSFAHISTRDDADMLRRSEVYIEEEDAAPLEEGEYFIHQLYGLHVYTVEGEKVGEVREVLQTGANDVLIVAREGQPDILIPMIQDVVQQVDFAQERIEVRLLEGLG